MKSDWQIRGSTVFGLTMLLVFLGFLIPVGIQFVAPFIGLFYFFRLKKQGRIKDFDWLEVLLVMVYLFALIFGLGWLTVAIFEAIPWYKIILVGMAADLFASVLGGIPVLGDIISGILVFILAFTIIGGIQGIIIAFAIALISILPGPSFGANTLFLFIFKLISNFLLGGGG